MKIGILTFHKELNYGAILQAYALNMYLSKNNNVEIINYNLNKTHNILIDIINLNKKMKFSSFLKRRVKMSSPITNNFEKEASKYDKIVVGSDQVWAYDIIGNEKAVYFLDYQSLNGKKYSYAASFGKDDNILNNKVETLNYLKQFNKISVREKSSDKILRELGLKCSCNVDPTLLLTEDDYVQNLELKKKKSNYIVVYMLDIEEKLVSLANEIAEKNDLYIVFFNRKNRFGKRGICKFSASPKEFVELFYNAQFVVTNSFHGTSFATIFRKKFIVFLHKTKAIRQINLLEDAQLMDHVYKNDKNVDYYLQLETKVGRKLLKAIEDSQKYLDNL